MIEGIPQESHSNLVAISLPIPGFLKFLETTDKRLEESKSEEETKFWKKYKKEAQEQIDFETDKAA